MSDKRGKTYAHLKHIVLLAPKPSTILDLLIQQTEEIRIKFNGIVKCFKTKTACHRIYLNVGRILESGQIKAASYTR